MSAFASFALLHIFSLQTLQFLLVGRNILLPDAEYLFYAIDHSMLPLLRHNGFAPAPSAD